MKEDDETLDSAAYFAQQSAEKMLKAYLLVKQPREKIARTHDLIKLLESCIKHDSTFEKLREAAEILFPYAIYARYPDDRFNIDRQEAEEAIKYAETILKFVKVKIEPTEKTPQMNIFTKEQQ
jgi:HEPN domain-containing protein